MVQEPRPQDPAAPETRVGTSGKPWQHPDVLRRPLQNTDALCTVLGPDAGLQPVATNGVTHRGQGSSLPVQNI